MSFATYDTERPWEAQPFDTAESFHWFSVYLVQLGGVTGRRLEALAGHGCRWDADRLTAEAREGLWRARAEAYDEHLRRTMLQAISDEVEEAGRAHARRLGMARRMGELGDREVKRLLRLQAQSDLVGTIEPRTAMHMVTRSIAAELAIQAAAVATTAPATKDYSKLTDVELDLLASLEEKAMAV